MTKAKFTVVIPTYNRADYIKEAIQSVLNQTYTRWKLLIIDDASTDDTVERVKPFLQDPRIELITIPTNQGISHVMNRALQEVQTEAFVQLDSDDWLQEDALLLFAKAMKKDPKAALYYGNIRMWKEDSKGQWRPVKVVRHRRFKDKYQFLIYMTYMLHPRCYRTKAVKKSGGWDTDDPYDGRIMEDRRMCVKLIEKNRFHWINKVLYNRRKHGNQLTGKDAYKKRNELRKKLVKKYLKKWGNKFRPEFQTRNGLLIVKRLVPLKKNQAGDRK
jgi:glycosyltransferase involved in cell wall biosynthesis